MSSPEGNPELYDSALAEAINKRILEIPIVTLDEALEFLCVQRDLTINHAYNFPSDQEKYIGNAATLQGAIDTWDTNRNKALLLLLENIARTREQLPTSAQACWKCVLAIMCEPIIPSGEKNLYQDTLAVAFQMKDIARKMNAPLMDVFTCYATAILVQAQKYCPIIFEKHPKQSEITSNQFQFYTKLKQLKKPKARLN